MEERGLLMEIAGVERKEIERRAFGKCSTECTGTQLNAG